MKVSAWDLVQPECRLPASDRHFLHKRHDAHLGAMRSVKPSIDNKTPPKAMGANSFKIALKQEEIDRNTQLLFAKLSNMHAKKTRGRSVDLVQSVSTASSAPQMSDPHGTRGHEKRRALARENSLIRRRLETVKSGLRAVDQKKDFVRHEQYVKQIAKVRSVSLVVQARTHVASPESPPSLVPLREGGTHTVSSGWSVELWGDQR
jgi:hypothetical protein